LHGIRSNPKNGPWWITKGTASKVQKRIELVVSRQFGTSRAPEFVEARRHPRFNLDIPIRIYPRNASVVRGTTVDISESGISAMLRVEVPIGEVVRLEFELPAGPVEVHALVCQRSAFRYGLQFVESSSAQEVIGRTCRELAMEQSLREAKLPKGH
jgi:hypothetical protein